MADLTALAVHEFSYQSLLCDLLHNNIIDHGTKVEYTIPGASPSQLTLDAEDDFWTDIRHLHISEASIFLSDVARKKIASSNILSLSDLMLLRLTQTI